MEQQVMTTLVRDRHHQLHRIAADVARERRARDEAAAGVRRLQPLRFLNRVLGPR